MSARLFFLGTGLGNNSLPSSLCFCRIHFLAAAAWRASVSCWLLARGHSQLLRLFAVSCNMVLSIGSSLVFSSLAGEKECLRCSFISTEYLGLCFCDKDYTYFSKLQIAYFSYFKKYIVIINHLNYTQKCKEVKITQNSNIQRVLLLTVLRASF